MASPAESLSARRAAAATVIVCACVVLGSGCSRHRVYRAGSLPQQLAAIPAEDVATLNLSHLGTSAVSSESIDRGDVLDVTITYDSAEAPPLPTPVRVHDDGTADVPPIGRVRLAGLEMDEAEQAIAAAAIQRGIYRRLHVTVTMQKQRINRVVVTGAVEKEGTYELPRGGSTLLAALVAAGGLTKEAGAEVEICRPARRSGQHDCSPARADCGNERRSIDFLCRSRASRRRRSTSISSAPSRKAGRATSWTMATSSTSPGNRPRRFTCWGWSKTPASTSSRPTTTSTCWKRFPMAGGRTIELADTVWVLRRAPGGTSRADQAQLPEGDEFRKRQPAAGRRRRRQRAGNAADVLHGHGARALRPRGRGPERFRALF